MLRYVSRQGTGGFRDERVDGVFEELRDESRGTFEGYCLTIGLLCCHFVCSSCK
jgi:hypothetical protein